MIEDTTKIITKNEVNYNTLIEVLKLTTDEEIKKLDETLEYLIKEKQIFLNCKNKYELITNNHVIGTLESSSKRKFVRDNKEKIFIADNDLHTALKYDLVVVERKNGDSGKIVGILNRKNNKLVCEVKEKNGKLVLVPFNGNKELSISLTKEISKELNTNYIIGDRVYIVLDNKIDENNTVLATNITKIGHLNDTMNDELAIAITKDFDIDFSKEAMEQAENIPEFVTDEDKVGRVDLTNETIFTIDSISTKDMDDAISIKKLDNGNFELGVHIADVAHYIKPGTPLFNEALKRGTSVYLGDVVIPMIPSKLSNGICSLNEGVERLTKSCIMEINPKGKIIKYKIQDTVIKSKKKMTYEELNKIFDGIGTDDETYKDFKEELKLAQELSDILSNKKEKRGNLEFESSDIKVKHDDNDTPFEFVKRSQGISEKIIENFMIVANETVATHFHWRNLPFVYRIHGNPDELKLDNTIELINKLGYRLVRIQNAYGQKAIQSILKDYKGTPEYTIISNLLLRNMSKAKYSTENDGHYALASDNYCHFTSPIRRFPDYIVHSLINIFINNNSKNCFDEETLKMICEHSSYKERQADDAERDYIKLKMAKYMEKHKDEEFEGIILDIDKDNVYVKLDNNIKGILDLDCLINQAFEVDIHNRQLKAKHSKQVLKLGTRIKFKVTKVDIPQKEIYFEIKDILKIKNNHTKKLVPKN